MPGLEMARKPVRDPHAQQEAGDVRHARIGRIVPQCQAGLHSGLDSVRAGRVPLADEAVQRAG